MPKNLNTTSVPTTDVPDEISCREQLVSKITSMTADELKLFIYLAEKELGLRFD